ncbi:MAG TPA: rod shape-determining protein MreC [Candidatus Acidoferrales bacterium]|nr:rod shape-determining protein MreC [Candidatus Acidoferrales bacterium]
MDVPSRHRPLVLLAAVIVAQVLLLAFQIKRGSDVRLIRVWSAELLTPLQAAGSFVINKIDATWFGYIDLRNAHAENNKLAEEVGRLRLKNQQLEGQAAEAVRLARLFGFRQQNANIPMVAAEVIGANADSNSHTVFINRGENDGIRRNMAVITPDGVVGRIVEALPDTSQVLLITDRESGLGGLLAGTRTHGVVNGTGEPLLRLDYVNANEKVADGAEVLTSGEDRIFPKDLPVGTVAWTKASSPFQTIALRPAAHLDRLEEVLVLLTEHSFNLQQKNDTSSSQQKTKEGSGQKSASAAPLAKIGTPNTKVAHAISRPASAVKKPVASTILPATASATPSVTPGTKAAQTPSGKPASVAKKPAAPPAKKVPPANPPGISR